ncbi:RNA-guided endonuclease InsQ/TnpB family protein [Tuanshanicoccus lijuaniae]|uniref:RNA-guided endonuclease InsQ/TnpB family protein n=1 Tax=Aerococcaceae bacterium zg-1292 TaxID=2774330 RepID=UPI001BD8A61F|nr:transposase [Aerococcaceae bacterium zg-A91]MBS4458759.1 transposase [Aerococcaceae bacterium zg-BR33]
MRSQKIRLRLTTDQENKAWQYAKVSRNYWNLLVEVDRRNNKGEFDDILSKRGNTTYYSKFHDREVYRLNQSDYRYLSDYLIAENYEKDNEKWAWYYEPNQSFIFNSIAKKLVVVRKHNKGKLNFRSVGKHIPSFNVRCDISANKKRPSRIYLKDNGKLQIPTLGDVKIGNTRKDFDLSCKKQVAQVSFDGKYWYLSYTEDVDTVVETMEFAPGVGVDIGIKNLATLSDGTVVPNIKTFRRVRILNKRLKRLQRKLSRKYLINQCNKHNKTKNIMKLEREIRLIQRTLRNIRINHIRHFVSQLMKKRPKYIAIEDLNVKGMMKNKHLAKDIANCSFYTIKEQLIRKAKERGIVVRLVDRYYPSSKTCSCCGSYKKTLKLTERTYHCDTCKHSIDRDLNAAYNLANTNCYQLA